MLYISDVKDSCKCMNKWLKRKQKTGTAREIEITFKKLSR